MAVVYRSARLALRLTRAQRRRCLGLLRAGGDVRAWIISCNAALREWGLRPVTKYRDLCRELATMDAGTFGELDTVGARSVLRRYSSEWHTAARRMKKGEAVGFPRRRRAMVPLRYYYGTFELDGQQLRLPTRRGTPPLWVRLARPLPYSVEHIRSVSLVADCGRLYVDVTAALPPDELGPDDVQVAGVDVGLIHPFAVSCGDEAMLVSGRAVRAEERLHLADTKARSRQITRKAPPRGQRGSRRWRKLRAKQRSAETRHRRRVRTEHHRAAKSVVTWAKQHQVGVLVVGDLTGITARATGRKHNLRLRQWRRTHLVSCLKDKAELAGIDVVLVQERGTSSTCPRCGLAGIRAHGRDFSCPSCSFSGHRDVVGAHNIAVRGGGSTTTPVVVTHRRVGIVRTRRDRRRQLMDSRRSGLARGRPAQAGSRSRGRRRVGPPRAVTTPPAAPPAPHEDLPSAPVVGADRKGTSASAYPSQRPAAN